MSENLKGDHKELFESVLKLNTIEDCEEVFRDV